jgi:hypothetical protein
MNTDELLESINEQRALVAAKLKDDPLPANEKEARLRLESEIAKYKLEKHVVELEMNGYTILPPGVGAPIGLTDRIRAAVLRVGEARQLTNQAAKMGVQTGLGKNNFLLLNEDRVIEEAVMNPVMLTMVTYLVGYRAKLITSNGTIKTNESDANLYFHTDLSGRVLPPWPEYSFTANVNWLLTDYNRENGALCVVPGSHLWRKPPPRDFPHDHPDVEVVNAPAGSLIVWHAGLWHGALRRTAEGKRLLMILLFARSFYSGPEPYWLTTTKEMIERNPARFGVLMGLQEIAPWGRRGPSPDIVAAGQVRDMGKWT